jgi:hypothetical protein
MIYKIHTDRNGRYHFVFSVSFFFSGSAAELEEMELDTELEDEGELEVEDVLELDEESFASGTTALMIAAISASPLDSLPFLVRFATLYMNEFETEKKSSENSANAGMVFTTRTSRNT